MSLSLDALCKLQRAIAHLQDTLGEIINDHKSQTSTSTAAEPKPQPTLTFTKLTTPATEPHPAFAFTPEPQLTSTPVTTKPAWAVNIAADVAEPEFDLFRPMYPHRLGAVTVEDEVPPIRSFQDGFEELINDPHVTYSDLDRVFDVRHIDRHLLDKALVIGVDTNNDDIIQFLVDNKADVSQDTLTKLIVRTQRADLAPLLTRPENANYVLSAAIAKQSMTLLKIALTIVPCDEQTLINVMASKDFDMVKYALDNFKGTLESPAITQAALRAQSIEIIDLAKSYGVVFDTACIPMLNHIVRYDPILRHVLDLVAEDLHYNHSKEDAAAFWAQLDLPKPKNRFPFQQVV